MSRETPTVLLLHEERPAQTIGNETMGDTLDERIPNVDVEVASDYDDSLSKISSMNVVLGRYLSSELLDAADDLEWIQSTSAGVNHFDHRYLEERGVILTSAAGIHAEPIAEQVLGYMLMFERNLHLGVRQQQASRWQRFAGGELKDKTAGIIGVGSIGARVAELATAFDMDVAGIKRDTTTSPASVDRLYPPDELHTLLGESDYVVISCPLTERTENMIGIKEFSSMKTSGVLINIARGGIVRQTHLTHALSNGEIGGAALDVTDEEPLPGDSPLWNLTNVVVTPHMAGLTPKRIGRLMDLFAENYRRFAENDHQSMTNRVV